MVKLIQILLVLSVLWHSAAAEAGNPAPLFDKPVKVDDSGRPLYNSWERYEYERQKRYNKRPVTKASKPVVQTVTNSTTTVAPTAGSSNSVQKVDTDIPPGNPPNQSSTTHNGATAPTPSSVIINRPVHNTGDPEIKLNDFNF